MQSSYLEESTDKNVESPPPKWKKLLQKKLKKAMSDVKHKHGKSHSAGVSRRHVQPISNVPPLPQAAKK